VDKWPHLGHIITRECTDTDDILNKKSSLIRQINKVLYYFRKVNCQTKTRLVKTYCTSLYGAELWDLSWSNIESICIAWREVIRCIWQLPNTTHSVLIPILGDNLPLLDLFFVCMLSFVHRCLCSESPLINFMIRDVILYGQIGRNISQCCCRYNIGLHNNQYHQFALSTMWPLQLLSLKYIQLSIYISVTRTSAMQRWFFVFIEHENILAMINSLCTC